MKKCLKTKRFAVEVVNLTSECLQNGGPRFEPKIGRYSSWLVTEKVSCAWSVLIRAENAVLKRAQKSQARGCASTPTNGWPALAWQKSKHFRLVILHPRAIALRFGSSIPDDDIKKENSNKFKLLFVPKQRRQTEAHISQKEDRASGIMTLLR